MTHPVEELHEYALNTLEDARAREIKAHLRVCRPCSQELGAINDLLVESILEPSAPGETIVAPMVRDKLLKKAGGIAPYSLYHGEMAKLLQGNANVLRAELQNMPHPSTWVDGPIDRCRLFPCSANAPERDAIRTLVLMESGSHFPTHEHMGDETVLVVQGSMLAEDGTIYRPGDTLFMPAGTSHAFDVPEGLDLIYLAVVDQGIRIGELMITPESVSK
jgi:anti-sigma factor ChrR (cupin superfamily)